MDDVQSWWEIPCIAHFCSLFRLYFGLIDFDIEELEEALVTDSVEDVTAAGFSLLQELIVGLLRGCFNPRQDEITTSNYQMYLRRLFRKQCEEGSTEKNPFETDAAFHSLPLRTKVEILYDLCDFRLDNEDVPESLKSLESDSLRVEPLGRDSGGSTYWYFYGTRLYREDYCTDKKNLGVKKGRKGKEDQGGNKWQVVCYTEEDWQVLTRKFKNCKSVNEKALHRTLSTDFLPELPRLFAEKERLQRKRMLERTYKRTILTIPDIRPEMAEAPSFKNKNLGKASASISTSDDEDVRRMNDDEMDEDEARRQREEQEKADRLLAEEIEREERKARLHLRERRGGAVPCSSSSFNFSSSTKEKSSTNKKGSGSRSSSATSKSPNKSPNKSPSKLVKDKSKVKGKSMKKRKTNNSMAVELTKKGAEESGNEEGEKEESCDEDEEKQESGSDQEDDGTSSPDEPSPKKKKTTVKQKKKDEDEKGKRSKSKDKLREKEKKKKKREKEKSKSGKDDKIKVKSDNANHSVSPTTLGSSKTKVKSSVLFSQTEEDVRIGMHKVIESIKNHGDAWPFTNPVDEDYAPNYYRVISSPMDLQTMEDKLDNQEYCSLDEFITDFHRIIDNCIQYNGPSSEYTEMADTVQKAFNKAVQRYIVPDESDDEINIEYNNVGTEKKRSKTHTHPKKGGKTREQKKENGSPSKRKTSPKVKANGDKSSKSDKKKLKNKLMKHRKERMGKPETPASEALKDIDKWLGETPKPTEYVSAGAAAFDNLRNRIFESENGREDTEPKATTAPGQKRKAERSRSPQVKSKDIKKGDSDEEGEDEDYPPPKKLQKKEKHGSSSSSSKTKPSKPDKVKKKSNDGNKAKKDGKLKDKDKDKRPHHHHHHHKHHRNNDSLKRDSSPIPAKSRYNGPSGSKQKKHSESSSKDEYYPSSPSDGEKKPEKPVLKHSKSVEEKKTKPPVKRGNSLLSSLKGSGQPKKVPQTNKPTKSNSFHQSPSESKFKHGGEPFGNKNSNSESQDRTQGVNRDVTSLGEKPEQKKKCLLLNDNSTDREGGPKLSLGTVLSTDAIKIGEFKKPEPVEDEENDASKPGNSESGKQGEEKGGAKDEGKDNDNDEEEEIDRKLEPSKGFKPEKCMPNLSAWIKAFGGPSKTTPLPQFPIKKPEFDAKSKFKVMGRGVGESSENLKTGNKHPVMPKPLPKHVESSHYHVPGDTGNTTEDVPLGDSHHKKHRHRKMSTSSMSSQSETGSPHPFGNQDGMSSGMGSVVNPPRWVDDHWTHAQTQASPSASSHVSSQSPANSPFSPAINSPPHTPQTPPRPVGPVRVGFYQDLTSQHSSPEKINEPHSNSNSNVASPSTPPTPTNNNVGRREASSSGKSAFGAYPTPVYAPRYAASTPSPSVGPGSNLQSPSPGGMTVETSPGNPNSPHSPTVSHPPETYRPSPYQQQNQSSATNNTTTPSGRQSATPSRSAHHRNTPSVLAHHPISHSPAPSITPYPPPSNHYGHHSSALQGHPENAHSASVISQAHQPQMAHMNQVQAHSQASHHQQHYDRYPPHSYHHQMSSTTASSNAYSQNLTMAHSQRPSTAQPSPYPSNPYTSNPRNVNIPPNVYSNPMTTDPAISRFYKPPSSISSDQQTSESSASTGSSRGRSSRSSAHAEMEAARSTPGLDGKLGHAELTMNGFQWPHNLASLSQIVNSIPNPMNAVGMANAYRQYDQAMAESMSKYQQRSEHPGYATLSTSSGSSSSSGKSIMQPPAAHSQPADKLPSDNDAVRATTPSSSSRRQSKAESKRSQSSSSKGQSVVSGSAFNFSSLSPADLALYPKEMSDVYSASPPGLGHRPDLYPASTSAYHSSFSSAVRTTAGGVPTPSISPYQIAPFMGSHPSPYQSPHAQPPRGLVDPYQQLLQSSPHVMGLLPPTGYYPHSLGFNRPSWI